MTTLNPASQDESGLPWAECSSLGPQTGEGGTSVSIPEARQSEGLSGKDGGRPQVLSRIMRANG